MTVRMTQYAAGGGCACKVPIGELEGSRVTTIEGLGGHHPVQQAWIAEQVSQCGFCETGFIMAIAALVDSGRPVAASEIDALPNLCRCGAYPRIRKAIARADRSTSAAPVPDERQDPARFTAG